MGISTKEGYPYCIDKYRLIPLPETIRLVRFGVTGSLVIPFQHTANDYLKQEIL